MNLSEATPTINLLPIVIPSIIAFVGTIVGYVVLRRSSKESNDTNKFKVITDRLAADNEQLRVEMKDLRLEVTALREGVANKDAKIDALEEELEETDRQMRWHASATNHLARYIERLVTVWPAHEAPPLPDPFIEWRDHL